MVTGSYEDHQGRICLLARIRPYEVRCTRIGSSLPRIKLLASREKMAGRPARIETDRRSFDAARLSSDNLVTAVRPYLTISYVDRAQPLRRKQAERILSYSFMTLMGSWEELVQLTYLKYLVGAASPAGTRPTLIATPQPTLLDAARFLTGKPHFNPSQHYHMWPTWNKLVNDANRHFQSGIPFSSVSQSDRALLGYAQAIRNRVAHRSKKCITHFLASARPHLGLPPNAALPQGMDAGRLLSTAVTHLFPVRPGQIYYEAYSNLLYRLSRIIAP